MLRPWRGIHPTCSDGVYVDPAAVVIGQVMLGPDTSIWPCAVLRGDMGKSIRLGARCNVQDNATIHITHAGPYTGDGHDTWVGDDVTIGHGATLHACRVGSRVLVGIHAVVMDGADIGDDTLIAAGSLVPPGAQLTGGWLYRGSPAKPARPLTEREREQLRYMAANYVRLKGDYLESSQSD